MPISDRAHRVIRIQLGKRIKALRRRKWLNQAEFAELIGSSESAVSRYERGLTDLPMRLLVEMSEVLDVKTSIFMDKPCEEEKPDEQDELKLGGIGVG